MACLYVCVQGGWHRLLSLAKRVTVCAAVFTVRPLVCWIDCSSRPESGVASCGPSVPRQHWQGGSVSWGGRSAGFSRKTKTAKQAAKQRCPSQPLVGNPLLLGLCREFWLEHCFLVAVKITIL